MARKDESLLNLLVRLPWWFSAASAIVAYAFLKFLIPLLSFDNWVFNSIVAASPKIAPLVTLLLLIAATFSAIAGSRKRRLLDKQDDIDTIKDLTWDEFEELVGEAFRRQGYFVLENPSKGSDGGVDLRMRKNGKKIYVQCKHWRSRKVSVSVIREFFGVLKSNNADEGIVVTYGDFTREAYDFAKGKPLKLVNGQKLLAMINEVQKEPRKGVDVIKPDKTCPKCGSPMVVKTAKSGQYAGQKFWGCSKFPECKNIVKYSDRVGSGNSEQSNFEA